MMNVAAIDLFYAQEEWAKLRRPGAVEFVQKRLSGLSKSLGDGLFELGHIGKLNTRVIWFFMKGKRIIAVHGIRNKGQAIPAQDLDTAEKRMRDWKERTAL